MNRLNKLIMILLLLLAVAFFLPACSGCKSSGGADDDVNDDINDDTDNDDIDDDDDDDDDDDTEDWYVYTIDDEGYATYMGDFSSIAVDSNDKIHIAYRYTHIPDCGLKYATNSSCSWEIFIVENETGIFGYTSIALDSNNKAHVAFYDSSSPRVVKYATNKSGAWQITTIEEIVTQGGFEDGAASIAVDSGDKVHISYYYCGELEDNPPYECETGDLKYITNKTGAWQTYTLDSAGNTGWYPSIALDSSGKVHMSYIKDRSDDARIKYVTNRSGSWQKFIVDDDAESESGWNSLALDSAGNAHIAYCSSTEIKYATNASKDWQVFVVEDFQSFDSYFCYLSIATDSQDKEHIAYYDWNNQNLKYATNKSGTWETLTIDSQNDVGRYPSIAIDSDDYMHISYYYFESGDNAHGELRYATNRPPE